MTRMLRGLVGLLGTGLLAAAAVVLAPAPARAIAFDIDWTGANGWTLEGSFSFPDALIGTGVITHASLTAFEIEVFSSGASQGTWNRFVDGEDAAFPFNLNFDTTLAQFVVGGFTTGPAGQTWNSDGGACPNPGVGFASGFGNQLVCVNGIAIEDSAIPVESSTLAATRQSTVVPLPASLLLVIGGGVALVAWRRR